MSALNTSWRQQQPRSRETPSPQQLREWYAGRGRSGGAGPCTYVLRTGGRRGETCGLPHTTHRCFGRLTDAWRAQFPDTAELPRWGDLLKQNVAIFDLDFDAILAAMYAVTDSAEGDCYLSVPPDLGIEAAALGASASAAPGTGESVAPGTGESALSGTAPTAALHTFTLDSGASRSFFCDSTTLMPLSRPVAVSLADPFGGAVLAHSSSVLPCPVAPSGLLSGLHLPSFSTNLVSGADLQDAWVDQFTLGGQRVTHCTCSRTGRHLATFTRWPGSSLYTLTTASPPITASGQVAASSQVFAAASRSSPASPPCSCRPLSHETLLWHHRLGHPSLPRLRGMASRTLVSGLPRSLPPLPPGRAPTCVPCVEGRQRAAPHSSMFPPTEAPLQTLHMDIRGPARVRGQGHERYFLLVVDDYLRYTTVFPLRSKGEVPEVLIDRIRGARRQLSKSFGSDLPVLRLHSDRGGEFSSDLLRAFCRAEGIRQTVLPPQPGGAESGSAEPGGAARERAASGGPPGVPSRQEPLSPQQLREWCARRCRDAAGARAAGGASGAAGGAARGAAGAGGAARAAGAAGAAGTAVAGGAAGGASGAAGGAACVGVAGAAGAAGAGGTARAAGGATGASAGGASGAAGPGGARTGGTGAARAGGVIAVGAVGTGAVATGGTSGVGVVGVTGAGGAAGVVAGDSGAEGTGAVSAVSGGAARPRPYYVPLLQQPTSPLPGPSPYPGSTRGLTERREPESRPVSPESRPTSPESRSALPVRTVRAGHRVSRPRPPPIPGTHSMTLRPSTAPQRVPLPSPPLSSLPDGPDPESDSFRAASPVVTRFLATVVTDPWFESTAVSALVAELVDFAAACRLDYATSLVAESTSKSVCPPSVRGECALGTDVLEDRQEEFECFAAAVPHLVSMLLAPEGDPDAPDIPTPRSYAEAIEGPYSSQWRAAMDAVMASWKSTGTYVDEVPPPRANIVSGMWIFRVKRPPGSPPVFKTRYVAHGFNQRRGVDFFQTFSPTPKMTTLWVLLHVAAHHDYELRSLDFSTAFLQGSLHEEIWLCRPPSFTGSFPAGTQWSLRRPVYGLRQALCFYAPTLLCEEMRNE
ncbi:unnamed protein product [Closterium sp. NIES-54]